MSFGYQNPYAPLGLSGLLGGGLQQHMQGQQLQQQALNAYTTTGTYTYTIPTAWSDIAIASNGEATVTKPTSPPSEIAWLRQRIKEIEWRP